MTNFDVFKAFAAYLEYKDMHAVADALDTLSASCQHFRRMPESCGVCPFLSYCEMVSDGEIIPLETIIKDILMPAVVEYADTKLREAEQ